ncbi:MAG: hypothetical protein NTW32_23000 [Chloroflexi bacterium]|nr:hypothetical protein [Chloroflexota bacterium]
MSKADTIHTPVSAPIVDGKRSLDSLRDMIGLISAGTGIFAALLYLAGRSFAGGYFEAMNIPGYSINFSIWEYGEVAWLPMFFYPASMFVLGGLFWGVFYSLKSWLSPLGYAFLSWLKNLIKIKLPAWRLPDVGILARRFFDLAKIAFVVTLFISFVMGTLLVVKIWGSFNGKIYVLESAARVELVSTSLMTLENPTPMPSQAGGKNNTYYIYDGFHLLTINNGKYYLFKEIDPVTCKPLKVYVIDADQYKQVNLLAAESLSDKCPKNQKPNMLATPTSLPTSTP